ncbi:MAG: Gfo/Idh/MocA family oxidoreductase [Spirochaetota bacterium]
MRRKKIRFGVIGLGLMGKEFGSAAARWCHLLTDGPVPEIIGVCDTNKEAHAWFLNNFPSIKIASQDYHDLISFKQIDAIYCAVPHNLHEKIYIDSINAKKHFMGEKPFGIDQAANSNILKAVEKNKDVVVRCCSEFPYFPGAQRLINWIKEEKFGRIIEVRAGFNHASDMDVTKPINWKRMVEYNGEYGCMGDLGIHTQHIPFRAGWIPKTVYALLSNLVPERPDGRGGTAPCLTWDNATLACEVTDKKGDSFPMFLETKRMDPGSTNTWYVEVYGMKASARFTTEDPRSFYYLEAKGKEQAWSRLNTGYTPLIPSITGSIFEFGFTDAILQMWAVFLKEIEGNEPPSFGCFTPEETRISHALQTAALKSNKKKTVEPVII